MHATHGHHAQSVPVLLKLNCTIVPDSGNAACAIVHVHGT